MPLHRRLPKRGFTNIFKREWAEVNLATLESVFDAGATVDSGVARREEACAQIHAESVVILGQGEIKKAITVKVHRFSTAAKQKIEAAGGTAEVNLSGKFYARIVFQRDPQSLDSRRASPDEFSLLLGCWLCIELEFMFRFQGLTRRFSRHLGQMRAIVQCAGPVFGRQPETHLRLRALDHALHHGIDHHAADDLGLSWG